MAKQRLNLFMKSQHLDEEGLFEKFGIDFDLLNALIRKERDEDGRVKIRWGEQKIS